MRHRVAGYRLKRDVGARKALLRNLATSVIDMERVVTTVPKAKAVKPLVEHLITLAKKDNLHARRQAAAVLMTPKSVKKLFDTLGTRFGQRAGGYTRIVRLGPRKGDGAEQAMIELVGSELVKRAADRAKRKEERLRLSRKAASPAKKKTRKSSPCRGAGLRACPATL
jgi:large subunit ribosomal protein L17